MGPDAMCVERLIFMVTYFADGETVEIVSDFIFLDSKITEDGDCSHKIKEAYSLEEKLWTT